MAAGLAFGVLFATGITLLLIPCLYLILDDIHNTATRIRKKIFGQIDKPLPGEFN
jgi:hypothetical protein